MIAFASNRAGSDGFDVYVMRADGGDQRRLTALPNDEGEPAWSPDGRSLAISAGVFLPTVGAVRDEIFRVNLDGTGLMRLTTNEADDYSPAWSPDGRGIAFVSDRAGSFDVWRMDAATGAAQRRLTTGRGNETHVDWGRRPRRR